MAIFAGCNSAPEIKRAIELQPDQAVEVAYVAKTARLGLENPARQALRDNPMAGQQQGYKRFDTKRAQDLLDALATYGYFERARASIDPRSADYLLVWIDGQTLAFSRPAWDGSPANQKATRTFLQCRTVVQEFYNATLSFYGSDMTADQLRREQERREAIGEDAQRRRR